MSIRVSKSIVGHLITYLHTLFGIVGSKGSIGAEVRAFIVCIIGKGYFLIGTL